jgi:hypothetical protein
MRSRTRSIQRVLDACGGKRLESGESAALPSRFALYRLMKRFGIGSEP